jgi:hypothetical protein
MAQQDMSKREQNCIAQCIFKHWSEHSKTRPEHRMDSYEQCLTDCQVCA